MKLVWCCGGLLGAVALAAGCSKHASEGATREKSLAVASEGPLAPPVDTAKKAEAPALEYEVLREFPATTQIDTVMNGLVFCECEIGPKPDKGDRPIQFFDGSSFTDLKGVLSDKKVSAVLGESVNRLMTPPKDMRVTERSAYRFAGAGPDRFVVVAHSFWDDDDTTRDGYGGFDRELKQTKAGWQELAPGSPLCTAYQRATRARRRGGARAHSLPGSARAGRLPRPRRREPRGGLGVHGACLG